MKLLCGVYFLHCLGRVCAINSLFIQAETFKCDETTALGLNFFQDYFKDQHSLTLIDFSENPLMSKFVCSAGNFLPFYLYDEWDKVNLGEKVDDSGLSAYSTTRGFFIKSPRLTDALFLLPAISKFNPRAKLLINVERGTFENARELLQTGYTKHKMLDVAVIVFTSYKDEEIVKTNTSVCLFNPFEGDADVRNPEFKCFNILSRDYQFSSIDYFIKERVHNLHQYPLRIDIFEEVLLSNAVRNANGMITRYEYADGDAVTQLSEIMNFTPIYVTTNEESKYGYQLSNGTFTGSLGSIENGNADLSAIPTFIADYNTSKSLFLQPIAMKKLFFIIQKPEAFRTFIIQIFNQLDSFSKIVAVSLCVLFPFIYATVNSLESKIVGRTVKVSFGRNMTYTIALMTGISSKSSSLTASRFLVTVILFYALMISSIFQGTIIKNLNRNEYMSDIKTVNELLQKDYKLLIERSLIAIFQDQATTELDRKLKKFSANPENIVESTRKGFAMAVANEKIALLTSDVTMGILNLFYDEVTGENTFDYVPEAVHEFYVSPMVPKDSPFTENFNFWLMMYREVGIQDYQVSQATYDSNIRVMIERVKNGKVPEFQEKSLKFADLTAVFCLHLIIMTAASITFLAEILFHACFQTKMTPKMSARMKKGKSFEKSNDKPIVFDFIM